MSSTPRSVGSEKRVSFAAQLEELSPRRIDAADNSIGDNNNESNPSNNLSEGDNQKQPSSATVNAVSPAEFSPSKMDGTTGEEEEEVEVEIPKSLSQIKQEVELSIPRAYTEDSTTGKSRGPWLMGCFIDNLCAPNEMRRPEEAVVATAKNEFPKSVDVADDSDLMNNLEREEPPSSPSVAPATTDFVDAADETIDEDAFLPPDSEEAFFPIQDTTVGEEAFLPVDSPADESFLDAAFLPVDADESAFLPPFQEESSEDNAKNTSLPESTSLPGEEAPKDKQEGPVPTANDSVTDESQLAGEFVSADPEASSPNDTTCVPIDDQAAVADQQTHISQLEGQPEVEIEFTAMKEKEAVEPPSVEKDDEEDEREADNEDEVVSVEVENTAMDVEVDTCENPNVGEDYDPSTSQNDNNPDCLVDTEAEASADVVLECDQTPSSPEKMDITGTTELTESAEDQMDTNDTKKPSLNAEETTAEEVGELKPESCRADQSNKELLGGQDNGNSNNYVADEYPVLSMEYTQSMNTDFANNEHENASDDESRDEAIEELRILLAKSQEEQQKAVEQVVKETEMRLSQDNVKEAEVSHHDMKPQQQELQQQQPTKSVRCEVESIKAEKPKPEPVVQITNAMKVASVVRTKFSDDQDAGDIGTLKTSLGSLLKNQKETIQSLRLKLGERDSTIDKLKTECNSFKEKYKVTRSSLTFAEKTLISLKAERTTAKMETKATLEKTAAKILEVEMSMETAKKIHALEQERSEASIAKLNASLADAHASLDLANAQLVIMEEQRETIKTLESSLQDANNSVEQAKVDAAQVEGQLKVSIEVLKLEATEKEKQMNEEMEQVKVGYAKTEEQLKETIATSQHEYEEMRLLCNQQSSDIMARESTITDLQDHIVLLEASKLEKETSNEALLQENHRLNGLVEQQQLTIANKERSLDEVQQKIRDIVESVQNADSLREDLQTEHEHSIALLNEKVKSLSMDCESLKSMVSLQSNDSENSDIKSVENADEAENCVGEKESVLSVELEETPSNTRSYDTVVEAANSDSTNTKDAGETTAAEIRAKTESKEDSIVEAVDPMFCSAASKSGEETANSDKSLLNQEIGEITTIPSKMCREQFKKMDSTVQNETKSKMSSFNQKLSSLTCGCVAGSSLEFPDNESLAGSMSIVDANPEEVLVVSNKKQEGSSPIVSEAAQNNNELGVQASQSTDSTEAGGDDRMAGVMFEGEDDAVEAVLHLEKCNYMEDLSLLKSKSSSSEISSKGSSDSTEKGNMFLDIAEYVDGGEVVPMTKKLASLGDELTKTKSEAKEDDAPEKKDSGLAVDKVGIFKAAFKNFQSEKEKLLKDAEIEKKKAIEAMRAQLEEEKRAFIEEQEKRYESLKNKPIALQKEPVKAGSSVKPSAARTKSKSPVRQTKKLSRVSGSPTIEKARASLRPTRGVAKPTVEAPRVPLYLRSSGEAAKKQKEQSSATKSVAARSTSVPKSQSRRPSAIRAPSPTASRPSSLRGARTSSIRAPSPSSSRPSSLRAPSPGATRLPSSARAPSPSARQSSIRAPSPSGLRGAAGSFRKEKVGGAGKIQSSKTSSLRASKLGKPRIEESSRSQSLAGQKMATKKTSQRSSIEISSLENSFSSLKKKQQSMTPRKAASEEKAVQKAPSSEGSGFDKALEKVDSEPKVVDNVQAVKSTEDVSTTKSEESKNGGEDDDSADTNTSTSNKEEAYVEIVYRRPEKTPQDCSPAPSQETVESTNNIETRTSVPECLDLLNAEISNSDCDLEDESEEEDALSDDSKEEAREEGNTPQRSEIGTAREEATSQEKLSDEHDVVTSQQREESAEVDVTSSKIDKLGPEVDTRKAADA